VPWEISYWLPTEPWLPIRWPPYEWEVISFPPTGQLPTPPDGAIIPWWKLPKDQWPFDAIPWEPKIFGAFSARKVTMNPEDLQSPSSFGVI
jgi:hypothetical protein